MVRVLYSMYPSITRVLYLASCNAVESAFRFAASYHSKVGATGYQLSVSSGCPGVEAGHETAGDGGVDADPFSEIAAMPCGKRLPHAHSGCYILSPIRLENRSKRPTFPPFEKTSGKYFFSLSGIGVRRSIGSWIGMSYE